ncbi:hypothetical protein J4447_00430 [Candidatus Pacearchaeota archaeon]|nr:hypothetical protein [Candidatus Pacearchaeota archaeon]
MDDDFSKLKLYHYKFSNINFPTNINIHNNNIVILVWGDSPVAFLVHSKQVADKYRKYFEEVWKMAKK